MTTLILRWALAVLVGAAALAWIAGEFLIQRTNPPQRFAETVLSQEADAVLRRACFDCHSHETRYPWYSYMPVASLVLAQHVREGREKVNFSLWGTMSAGARAEAIEESLETVADGSMPTWDYPLLHPEARLTAADEALLRGAATKMFGAALESAKQGGKDRKKLKKNRGQERRDRRGDDDD
jgi:hypothetical protein